MDNTRPGFEFEIEPIANEGDPIHIKGAGYKVLFWQPDYRQNHIARTTDDPTFFTPDGLKTASIVWNALNEVGASKPPTIII